MSGFTIRPYDDADMNACIEIFNSNVPEYFRDAERTPFRDFLLQLPGPYFVVEDEQGRAVACGGYAIRTDVHVADLCWGMVRRELHRSGIGRLLTKVRLDAAKLDPTVAEVALNTSQLTTGFYETLGFRTIEVIPDGYAPGLDRCEMRLTFPTF